MRAAAYPHPITSSTFSWGRRSSSNGRNRSFVVWMGLNEAGPSLAVVGVTGAVGQEFLSVLSDRDFPYRSIRMLASKRSAGKRLSFEEKEYVIEELNNDSFDDIDIALFSAGGSISKEFGPIAVSRGCVVVDNSSAFRMEPGVPLVIPEVNPQAMADIRLGSGKGALIANPNCSTIICLMAATPLHRHAKVVRMVVSTYQAASGAGAAAMEELELQTREVLEGKQPTCKIFKQQYAFNLFSHNAPVLSNGYNEEEMKLVKETRKIWNDENVKVTATCIRVPVMRAHAESVNLQFEKPLDEDTARQILKSSAGVVVIDDRASNHFPTPLEVHSLSLVSLPPSMYRTKMMLQWVGYVVMCPKTEILGWTYSFVAIRFARELPLMRYRLQRCCSSLNGVSEMSFPFLTEES
ncbi:uncharacterized protein LOC131243477 isoform X2 [Magnolia sinica]|uniref:uncharacterized protein LOC131243477 isoform X2 n=1 Tax=Magnolia sinica TaxID=86752 RepID=UPI002659F172|nr:uncharacterized protein LOC131243477 isoform X2 [Magnolia sinica]